MTDTDENLLGSKNILLTYGLLAGVTSIIFLQLLFTADINLLLNPLLVVIGPQLIAIVFMIGALVAYRKAHANYIDYKTALRHAFGTAVLSLLFFTIYWYLLYNVIAPELQDRFIQKKVETAMEMGKAQNWGTLQITDEVAYARAYDWFSIKSCSIIYAGHLFLAFIFALIISLTFKTISLKNKPLDLAVEGETN